MKRRTFLGVAAGAGIAAPGLVQVPRAGATSATPFEKQLAGFTLEELQAQYRHDLFDDFLPFMERHVIDDEYGGFMCHADRDGTQISTRKQTWYEGRGIWVYSFLYRNLAPDPQYLRVARKSVEFILRSAPTGSDLWPAAFERQGSPVPGRVAEVYGDLFVAAGLAEYSRATAEARYRRLAKDILLKCLKIYDSPDYVPVGARTYLGADADPLPGARVLGHWMGFLWTATRLLEAADDPDVEEVVDHCIDAVMNRHYREEFDLVVEILNHDFSPPEGDAAQIVDAATVIEALWMVLQHARRRRDEALFNRSAAMLRRHFEVAWDDVYGGVLTALTNVDGNQWRLLKALWAQEEALIGTMCLVENPQSDQSEWARETFSKLYTYVQDRFPLRQYGHPLWILYADRKVTYEPHYQRVGNFHHPRHLMLNLMSIDRLLAAAK